MELKIVYCENIPETLEEKILYISELYGLVIHLCSCGCKQETVTPFRPHSGITGWTLTKNGDKVSLRPSIGNFNGENPYHAHYYITDNKIQWL